MNATYKSIYKMLSHCGGEDTVLPCEHPWLFVKEEPVYKQAPIIFVIQNNKNPFINNVIVYKSGEIETISHSSLGLTDSELSYKSNTINLIIFSCLDLAV